MRMIFQSRQRNWKKKVSARVNNEDSKTPIDMIGIDTKEKLDKRLSEPPNVRTTEATVDEWKVKRRTYLLSQMNRLSNTPNVKTTKATVDEWKAKRRTDSLSRMNRLRIFMYKNQGTLTEDGERVLSTAKNYSVEE